METTGLVPILKTLQEAGLTHEGVTLGLDVGFVNRNNRWHSRHCSKVTGETVTKTLELEKVNPQSLLCGCLTRAAIESENQALQIGWLSEIVRNYETPAEDILAKRQQKHFVLTFVKNILKDPAHPWVVQSERELQKLHQETKNLSQDLRAQTEDELKVKTLRYLERHIEFIYTQLKEEPDPEIIEEAVQRTVEEIQKDDSFYLIKLETTNNFRNPNPVAHLMVSEELALVKAWGKARLTSVPLGDNSRIDEKNIIRTVSEPAPAVVEILSQLLKDHPQEEFKKLYEIASSV